MSPGLMTQMALLTRTINKTAVVGAMARIDAAREAGGEALEALAATVGMTPRGLRACRQVVWQGEVAYPAKLVVALAGRVSVERFSGGTARLAGVLSRVGFRMGTMVLAAAPLVAAWAMAAHNPAQLAADVQSGATVAATFVASGTNRAPEIRGFASIGQAFMGTVTEINDTAEDALLEALQNGAQVMLDSGEFGAFMRGGHLTEAQIETALDLYARLGAVGGGALTVVGLDRIGDQDGTLELNRRYSRRLQDLIGLGVHVMVALQRGERTQAEFEAEITAALGTDKWVRALPCNACPTPVEEVASYCRTARPVRLHLLGVGLRRARGEANVLAYARAVAENSPETELSMDANLIAESVGARNGRGNHPAETRGGARVYTAAQALARALVAAGRVAACEPRELGIRLAWGGEASVEALRAASAGDLEMAMAA